MAQRPLASRVIRTMRGFRWEWHALALGPLTLRACLGISAVHASMFVIGVHDWDNVWIQSYREAGELRVLIWNRTDEAFEIQFSDVRYVDDGSGSRDRREAPLADSCVVAAGQVVSVPRPQVTEGSYVGVRRNGKDIGILSPTRESPEIAKASHAIVLDGFVNGSFAPSRTGPAVLALAAWPSPGEILDLEIVVDAKVDSLEFRCFGREDRPCSEPLSLECVTGVVTLAANSSRVVFDRTGLPEGMAHRVRGLFEVPRDVGDLQHPPATASPVLMVGVIAMSKNSSHSFGWMVPIAASITTSGSDRN